MRLDIVLIPDGARRSISVVREATPACGGVLPHTLICCYKSAMVLGTVGSGKIGAVAVFVAAAVLEVVGDALIRKGLRGSGMALIGIGFAVLGTYGVVVNLLNIDFSRLLGAYVGVFAVVSVVIGRFLFDDVVPTSTWLGLAVILGGSAIIHLGRAG